MSFSSFSVLFLNTSARVFFQDKVLEEHLQFVLIKSLHILNCRIIRMIIMKELLSLGMLNGVFEFQKSYVLLDLFAIVLSHVLEI